MRVRCLGGFDRTEGCSVGSHETRPFVNYVFGLANRQTSRQVWAENFAIFFCFKELEICVQVQSGLDPRR